MALASSKDLMLYSFKLVPVLFRLKTPYICSNSPWQSTHFTNAHYTEGRVQSDVCNAALGNPSVYELQETSVHKQGPKRESEG